MNTLFFKSNAKLKFARYFSNKSSNEIRKTFLDFFVENNGHTHVPSSPVVSLKENAYKFTTSGMEQFKSIFLGLEPSSSFLGSLTKAANSQKCIRTTSSFHSHNCTHHTFFEMLGNWSFREYSKEKSCSMAWELLTKVYKIPQERLYVTYFGGNDVLELEPDLECRDIWLKIGLDPQRVLPFGIRHNFWESQNLGGPCGPSTEIHYDHIGGPNREMLVNNDKMDIVELWNLVFIQYNKQQNGNLIKLNSHSVDTGMGLERLTAILQGSSSNYDTDLFTPIFRHLEKHSNKEPYQGLNTELDVGYRKIADNARMISVAIADGVLPGDIGPGNFLRTHIMTTLYLTQKSFEAKPGTVASLIDPVVQSLGIAYPELYTSLSKIKDVINEEEENLNSVLNNAHKDLQKLKESGVTKLSVDNVEDLLIRNPLQKSIIRDLCQSYGLNIFWKEFEIHKTIERYNSGKSVEKNSDISAQLLEQLNSLSTTTTDDSYKYKYTECNHEYKFDSVASQVVACANESGLSETLTAGEEGYLILSKTNFYSKSACQQSDQGIIVGDSWTFKVNLVLKIQDFVLHKGKVEKGTISNGSTAHPMIDTTYRVNRMRNNTAAYLLAAALHKLFPATEPKSSYIGQEFFRYAYSTKTPLRRKELREIEELVNKVVKQHLDISSTESSKEAALQDPDIIYLPDQMYPDKVSIIKIGENDLDSSLSSKKHCGSTHVHNTEHIGEFILTSQLVYNENEYTLCACTGQNAATLIENGNKIALGVKQALNRFNDTTVEEKQRNAIAIQDVKNLRKVMQSYVTMPLIQRLELEKQLGSLWRETFQVEMKVEKDLILKEVHEELDDIITSASEDNLVYLLKTSGPSKLLVHFIKGFVMSWSDKPTVIGFLTMNKKHIVWQAIVPKEKVTESFCAEKWLSSIFSKVTDVERPDTIDTKTYYRMTVNNCSTIDESIKILSEFNS